MTEKRSTKTDDTHDDDKAVADKAAAANKAKPPEPTGAERSAAKDGGSPPNAPPKDPPAPGQPPKTEVTPGHPEPLAQIKHTSQPLTAGSLATAINELPQLPSLDGVRTNLAYYEKHPDELVKIIEALPIPKENANGLASRDALVARLKAGEI